MNAPHLTRAPRVLAVLALFTLAGCTQPDLLARGKVISPRILDIVAEPPEIRPGQLAAVRVVTGGLTVEPTFRWFVCANAEATTTFTAQSTFGQATPNEGCFGDASVGVAPIPGTGPGVVFGAPANILDQIDALRAVYGASLSSDTLRRIARTAGIPVTVAVEMTHGTTVVRAIKRVVIADRSELNTNPPAPQFHWGVTGDAGTGGTAITRIDDADPDACGTPDGQPLVVDRHARVQIAPDPTEAPWLEQYDALDAYGNVYRATESAFYSWYATEGSWASERTQIPTRNTIWTAPDRVMRVTHWLIVRDGRGGSSVCRYEVDVR